MGRKFGRDTRTHGSSPEDTASAITKTAAIPASVMPVQFERSAVRILEL